MTEKEFDKYSEIIGQRKKDIENYKESIEILKQKLVKCKSNKNNLTSIDISLHFKETHPKDALNYCYSPLSNNIIDDIISYMEKDLSFYKEALSIAEKYLKKTLDTLSTN